MLKNQGHDILLHMRGDVAKKDNEEQVKVIFTKRLLRKSQSMNRSTN